MMDKLNVIKKSINFVRDEPSFKQHVRMLDELEIDWLIKEIERLRIVEQAYEGMKKAL